MLRIERLRRLNNRWRGWYGDRLHAATSIGTPLKLEMTRSINQRNRTRRNFMGGKTLSA